jgi:acid stress-induced BolA-like protein IbaG/YrbA
MDIREKIRDVLMDLNVVDPQVQFLDGYGYRVVAVVVSKTFEGMPDGDRQHLIWRKLLEGLTDREQEWVEFVFARAPSEWKRGDASSKVPVAEVEP